MLFDYANKESDNLNIDPEYQVPYGAPKPYIKSRHNVSFLQFIDLIAGAWALTSPEISFVPYAENHKFDDEKGYIVYSLVSRAPQQNFIKPKLIEVVPDCDNPSNLIQIWMQSFRNYIKFTAMHKNPRVAEELLENFEDFMTTMMSKFHEYGVEECVYGQRPADEHKNRAGEDIAARSVIYVVHLQKLTFANIAKIEEIWAQVTILNERNSVPVQFATPNSDGIHVVVVDTNTYATPSD